MDRLASAGMFEAVTKLAKSAQIWIEHPSAASTLQLAGLKGYIRN